MRFPKKGEEDKEHISSSRHWTIEKPFHGLIRRKQRKDKNNIYSKEMKINSKTEVYRQIVRLKLKKSPGEDGLRNEVWKNRKGNIVDEILIS